MSTAYTVLPPDPPPTLVGDNTQVSSFNLANYSPASASGFVTGDTIDFMLIPPGALVTDIVFDLPQVEGATTSLISIGTDLTVSQGGVGIDTSTTGFFYESTAGRSATYNIISELNDSTYIHASLPFYFPGNLKFGPGGNIQGQFAKLRLKFHTGPATPETTGVIWCTMRYTMLGDATQFGQKNL